ncbi:MAG: HTH domain-containing protein [Candidatus Thiodiazotropha sp. (ex Lucinoma aequizonata)]|nr:HTH domain-containing protein [Candidatus Thiodiazotropha sp. (ex Lucinoma aequizonata)]MCU7888181.1 HTH domain-containing protein [Candidatus Thiodiazotropha sp. (ex Lucinoma aequizonata)]MCU7894520.1 HTH domain-containing protein [Candidatus Thiodiazotropha sp. (ex Lucinoma aequizonata)]MCU7897451.1 HTH domain-containing protein [Candidatus Thiodiazotropha sp. (ex Lucinoma aequizonata)]MCU7903654.1 HTH domain-containing protein [Candidatus Thiodiazotropha sp. (ex Lucinoma aequizonata)]
MRRADRFFRITQELETERYLTAQRLVQRLEVSQCTIYRDIDDSFASGVPIEAGYRLCKGFRLPPLRFDDKELIAPLFGMCMVQSWQVCLRSRERFWDIPVHQNLSRDRRHVCSFARHSGHTTAPTLIGD